MMLEIRTLNQDDAGELFRLRRNALLDAPLAFLASPEDDLASSEATVRELLKPQRDSVVFGAYTHGLTYTSASANLRSPHNTYMKKPSSRCGELSRTLFDSSRESIASVTCGFHWTGAYPLIPTIPQKDEFSPPRAAECPNPICVSSFATAEVIFPC